MRRCVRPVIMPLTFASTREHVSRLGDVGFWWPYVTQILERHDLLDAGREPVAGLNATHPTFLCGDIVLKLFGHSRGWRASHAAERGAQRLAATDPRVAAPKLLGEAGGSIARVLIRVCGSSTRGRKMAALARRASRRDAPPTG